MNEKKIPGTTLCMTSESLGDINDLLRPIFKVTGGLVISQIKELTGLETSTLQNWVKRGWVPRPVNKKYGQEQLARILLINMLRDAMQLEKIIWLLQYINGDIEDEYDNIIKESTLYNYVVKVILSLDGTFDRNFIELQIDKILADYHYEGPMPNSAQRLRQALLIMSLAYAASLYKQQADALMETCKKGE